MVSKFRSVYAIAATMCITNLPIAVRVSLVSVSTTSSTPRFHATCGARNSGPARKLADALGSAPLLLAGELAAKLTTRLILVEAGKTVRQNVSLAAGTSAGTENVRSESEEAPGSSRAFLSSGSFSCLMALNSVEVSLKYNQR